MITLSKRILSRFIRLRNPHASHFEVQCHYRTGPDPELVLTGMNPGIKRRSPRYSPRLYRTGKKRQLPTTFEPLVSGA